MKSRKEIKKEIIEKIEEYRLTKRKAVVMNKYISDDSSQATEKVIEDLKLINIMEGALNSLTQKERLLIIYRYIENNGEMYDYIVKNKLRVSERTYYRIKNNALLKLHEYLY